MAAPAPVVPITEAFYAPSVAYNNGQLRTLKSTTAAVSGATAGILGLTNFSGFAFYLVSSAVLSTLVLAIKGGSTTFWKDGPREVLGKGLLEHLFSFVLFWTFAFALCHIYN